MTQTPTDQTPRSRSSAGGLRLGALCRHEETLTASQEVVEVLRALASSQPDVYQLSLATALTNLGEVLTEQERYPEALAAVEEAVRLFAPLFLAQPHELSSQEMVDLWQKIAAHLGKEPDRDLLQPILEELRRHSSEPDGET